MPWAWLCSVVSAEMLLRLRRFSARVNWPMWLQCICKFQLNSPQPSLAALCQSRKIKSS